MGILDGKKLLITGVVTDDSLAFHAAQQAQAHGAEVEPEVFELDVTVPEHLDGIRESIDQKWGRLDGVLHAIAFAPLTCLGEDFFAPSWEEVSTAMQVSTYSYSSLTQALVPLFEKNGGGSVIGLDFDAQVTWPSYNWMGVAKAGLESLNRYLARTLGPKNIRCNLIAAGPVHTIAGKGIPGFVEFEDHFGERSPLGWNNYSGEPVGRACVGLFSDLFPATTGEIIHVDGGRHIEG
jgi:meromycolic acid enoyl-[acyl-carrier-protein] reductase